MELRTERFKLKDIIAGLQDAHKEKEAKELSRYAQRLHKKLDDIEFVRKGIPIDEKDIDIKAGERAAIRLVSTPHLDRDNDILVPHEDALKDFRESPVVLYGHDYRGLPIGHDEWIKITKEGILAKTIYAKHRFAEDVYQCVKDKHLRANSVGFIPLEAVTPEDKKLFSETQDTLEKDYGISKDESSKAKNIYTKWLMLEHSDVPVASNIQSLNIAVSKGLLNIESERLKKDLEIQVVKDVEIEVVKDVRKAEDSFVKATLQAQAEKIDKEFMADLITKPETTDNYIRIPVESPDKHKGHRIRTITISAKEGIKALYCGECKKVITYLFDIKKWSMEEAKKWIAEHKEFSNVILKEPTHKERWNKSLSKIFDIEHAESSVPLNFSYMLYEKFLECKVKEIFLNSYSMPAPLLGTYLAGFKEILGKFKLKDTRSFTWDGSEVPPQYEVINLNSEKSDDFLVSGICFYDANGKPLIVKYDPTWTGLSVSVITSAKNKEWNKELLDNVHSWVHENNYLKGEKFALTGEFLNEPGDNWDNLILEAGYKDSIMKSANLLEKKGKDLMGRGLLFIGPPGTGKTKTGRVLMNELDTTFIWVSSRDFRKIGPLSALAMGFSLARDLAPSVLFLEDIDTWLRGEMEYVTDLVKTEMDGIKQNKGILTILTSNYPEKLPDALLDRPGRFHHIINFELPKEKERREMIKSWAGEIDDELLKGIVEKTDGFSGAHLKELVTFAKMIAEEDEVDIGEALAKSLDKLIEQRELIEEIRESKPNAKEFWASLKWAGGNIITKEADRTRNKLDIKEKDDLLERQLIAAHENKLIAAADYTGLGFSIKRLTDQIAELKEGRVLSTKNRTLIKSVIEAIESALPGLKDLLNATEPPEKEKDEEVEASEKVAIVEMDSKKVDINVQITKAIENLFSNGRVVELLNKSMSEAIDLGIKKKLGRVE